MVLRAIWFPVAEVSLVLSDSEVCSWPHSLTVVCSLLGQQCSLEALAFTWLSRSFYHISCLAHGLTGHPTTSTVQSLWIFWPLIFVALLAYNFATFWFPRGHVKICRSYSFPNCKQLKKARLWPFFPASCTLFHCIYSVVPSFSLLKLVKGAGSIQSPLRMGI